jgi:hypothetical protein
MKIEKEKKISFLMIDLYYKKHKELSNGEKEELKKYVELRLNKCPFQENKTFCSNCKIHCYKKDMQEKIIMVMRYSGPRMILYHPILAIRHLRESKREKKNGKK